MLGRLKRLVTHPEPARQVWAADIFVELASGWRSGMSPHAADAAVASVRDDPDCVATAYDSARVDQAVVPTLRIQSKAVEIPEAERAAWLDATADEFRGHMDPRGGDDFVRAVDRVRIPAGEAVRVEIAPGPEPGHSVAVVQVQFYVHTDNGPMALWFACHPDDLEDCRGAFEQMARTFLYMERPGA
jgi:hypothetical protein